MNKILLVDDDLELTQLLTEILTLEGFEVTVAEDGEEGLLRLGVYAIAPLENIVLELSADNQPLYETQLTLQPGES